MAGWAAKDVDATEAERLARSLGCPRPVANILVGRRIGSAAEAEAFLHPGIAQMHDPAGLLGMDAAVGRILRAIQAQEPMLIYGDYDVDGTTATVLLKTTIERAGLALQPPKPQQVTYHVPHRIREGYGMQNAILGEAAASGVRLVISVDTGIRAIAEAVEARKLGLDLIVTDHHLPDADEPLIPDCLAVINPNQPGCEYPNKNLCGAAVAFKLTHALLLAVAPLTADAAAFRTRIDTVLVPSFLKLVAIATIADSVPLTGENRAIAALGLAALARPVQPGLRALMQVAKIPLDRAPTATEVGFRLAPRINAAGRMDIAGDVVELLLTRDVARAQELAEKLDGLNQARRATEATALASIEEHLRTLVGADKAYPADCIVLDHPEWHRGVLGILASRVVERTGRPALVVTHAEGDAHGSGRSIAGFHLLDAITAADAMGPLFHRFGGHAHAVGFSLPSAGVPELRARISAYSAGRLTGPMLEPAVEYDAEVGLAEITPELYGWVERCAPFGNGNPEPMFFTRDAGLAAPVRMIQEAHVALGLRSSGTDGPATVQAVGWSRTQTDWAARCTELGLGEGSPVEILYRLKQKTGAYANPNNGGLELELCALRAAGGTRAEG